jgi:SAM-dependent methyltransferase
VTAWAAQSGVSDYDVFAPYYDAFTADSDYETWTVHVLQLARRHGLHGHALLDLACGTGKSLLPFGERGFHMTGCDASHAMLAEAARRVPEAVLAHADMRELPSLGRFDLVTCFDDSLNHLLGEDELAAAFAGIERNLRVGGLAMFDLNSLVAYRTSFATHCMTERDGVVFCWRGLGTPDAEPGCSVEVHLDVFAPAADGGYERVTMFHRQRHFERDRVIALLDGARLECVAVHGVRDDATLAEVADETRHLKVLYTARRPEGGDAE